MIKMSLRNGGSFDWYEEIYDVISSERYTVSSFVGYEAQNSMME